jgi:DNA-binding transcriptional LysR family regulator
MTGQGNNGRLLKPMAPAWPTVSDSSSRPGAQVALDECALNVPVDSLMSGTLDLAIVRGPFPHPSLETETLFREPLCAVVPDSHALARRKRIALDALADEAFVLFPRRRACLP